MVRVLELFINFHLFISKKINDLRGLKPRQSFSVNQNSAFNAATKDADLSVRPFVLSLHRNFHWKFHSFRNCVRHLDFETNHQKVERQATRIVITTMRWRISSLL